MLHRKVAYSYMRKTAFNVMPLSRLEEAPAIMEAFSRAAIEELGPILAPKIANLFREVKPSDGELDSYFQDFLAVNGNKKVKILPSVSEGISVLPRRVNQFLLRIPAAIFTAMRAVRDILPNQRTQEIWNRNHVKTISEWVAGLGYLSKNSKAISYNGYLPAEIHDVVMEEFRDFLKAHVPAKVTEKIGDFAENNVEYILSSFLTALKRSVFAEKNNIENNYKKYQKRAFLSGGGFELSEGTFRQAIYETFENSDSDFSKVISSYLEVSDVNLAMEGLKEMDTSFLAHYISKKFVPYIRYAFKQKPVKIVLPRL